MDKPDSFTAFEILYWCGLRVGEPLALTPAGINLSRSTISVTKSHQRIHGRDVVTDPKTKKSVRTAVMSKFLMEEVAEYLATFRIDDDEHMLPFTKTHACVMRWTTGARHRASREYASTTYGIATCPYLSTWDSRLRQLPTALAARAPISSFAMRICSRTSKRTWQPRSTRKRWPLMPCPNDHHKRKATAPLRTTPKQAKCINDLVSASDMTKRDYVVKRLECEDIVVTPSSCIYEVLRDRMRPRIPRAIPNRRRRLL